MARQNNSTPFVRSCIALWLAGTSETQFSVADIITGLKQAHTSLESLDSIYLCKSVSNELTRLEYIGKLESYQGTLEDGCGVGRPPRVYRRRVCPALLSLPTNGTLQESKVC